MKKLKNFKIFFIYEKKQKLLVEKKIIDRIKVIRNLFIKNSISKEHLNQNILRKFTKNLKPVLKKIKKEIYLPNKTLNILNEKFKINFNLKDLKRFKKFQTIALIGMGLYFRHRSFTQFSFR